MEGALTVGIDMAASERETAICRIRWGEDGAEVGPLETPADDAALLAALHEAQESGGRAGVDCPFGWPDAFVDAVVAHRDRRAHEAWPDDREPLRLRVTDRLVRDDCRARNEGYRLDDPRRVRVTPLSPSTDRLGVVVLRWARILGRLGPVDRTGAGAVVEAYPAAALHRWELLRSGLRDPIPDLAAPVRAGVLDQIQAALPGLRVPQDVRATLCDDGHAFDALTAALVARAATRPGGADEPADGEQRDHAPTEGWIVLPRIPLADLGGR